MKKAMLMTLAAMAAATAMSANLVWVGGAEGDWNDAQNWDPQQIPTQNDTVFFDSAESITVNLGAEQAHGTLSVSNTPCLFFKGLETGSRMDVRNDSKWTLYAPVVFDENTYVRFTAGKVWTNNSTIDFLGGVGANNSTPTLGGTGLYKVRGPVDFPSGVTLAAPIDWEPSSVTAETFYNVNACDWQFNGAPHVEGHLVRFSGGTGGFGGVAPLTVKSPDDTRPSAGFNNYANPNLRVNRTMPTVFEDWFALCLANACNNNKVGFQLGSGANLWIPADITTANVRNFVSESPTGGFRLNFQGCGANVRLTGDNSFQGGGSSMELQCANGCGYNSIEIDGEGNTIHPFGEVGGKLFANNGHGVFLRPMRPGLTLANGLSYGNSVNNNNAYTFGFDGTNDLTIAGDLVMGTGNSMVPVIGDMTLTLTGTIDPKATHLDFVGTGDAVLAPTSQFTGSTGRLEKHGSGSLTLQGALAGTSYNKAYFAGGRTILDYSVSNVSRLNSANSANLETPAALADALRLRGTELVLKGGSVAETVGAGNGTTFQNGLTKIRREGGTSTIHLGEITPSATASHGTIVAVDVEDGVVTVDSSLAGQNLKGAYTVGGDHFAAVDADGVITKANDSIATKFTGDASTTRTVVDYIIIDPTADDQTLTLGATGNPLVANKDGIIFRGDHDYAIEGGWLGGANTYSGGLIFTCAGTGVLTFSGKLDRYGFAKTGPGTFKHTGTSNLSQALAIYEGVFEAASADSFSPANKTSYYVYLNGGTLKMSVDITLARPLSIGDNGGVIDVVTNTTFTHTANIVTTTDGTSGPVMKRGAGVWLPSGDFQAQSELRIEEGTVRLGHASGIGNSTSRTRAVAPTKILADGTLDVAGFTAHVGNVYLKGGKITDSATGGSLGAYTFFAESGEVDVPLTDVQCPNSGNYLVANNLEKSGPGTVTLSAANEYTGTTFVREGVLELPGSLAGTVWIEGGMLVGSGSIAGYTYVDGGAISAGAGASLTLGDNLAFGPGGRLAVAGTGAAPGTISLDTAGALLYIDEAAIIDFQVKGSGGIGSLVGEHVIIEMPEEGRVIGEFAGFTAGRAIDRYGNRYAISYAAGDGNDIAITGLTRGTLIYLQ